MTFKAIIRKDVIYKNNTSPLCIQFLHDGRKKTIGLGISIAHEYWNAEAQKVTDDCPDRDNIQFQFSFAWLSSALSAYVLHLLAKRNNRPTSKVCGYFLTVA